MLENILEFVAVYELHKVDLVSNYLLKMISGPSKFAT